MRSAAERGRGGHREETIPVLGLPHRKQRVWDLGKESRVPRKISPPPGPTVSDRIPLHLTMPAGCKVGCRERRVPGVEGQELAASSQ